MAGIKIVDLPALGRDLLSTDLLEMSIGGTASRKITGQEIMNASKLNVGSTPIVSGTVGRVLFQGTGNVLQQSSSLFWDSTNNRLGIGTDTPSVKFQSYNSANGTSAGFGGTAYGIRVDNGGAFSAGRSTIFGVDNTFTGSYQPLSIEASSIALQAVTNGNVLIGTTSDAGFKLNVIGTGRFNGTLDVRGTNQNRIWFNTNAGSSTSGFLVGRSVANDDAQNFFIYDNIAASTRFHIASTGNISINTTTDAGFRLDVNGTARVQGNTTVALNQNAPTRISITNTTSGNAAGSELLLTSNSSALFALGKVSSSYTLYKIIAAGDGYALNTTNGDIAILNDFATGRIKFATGGASTAQMTLFSTGNFGINTTTDAGFRLDVNGTARFVGNVSLGSPNINDKLEVYGNILVRANDRIRLAGTSDGNTALWANSGSSAQMNVKNGSGSAFDITFGSIGSTTRMLRVHSYDSTTPSVVVGNNATAFASSVLTAESTTQGFLPPRMTTTQKNAIASPAAGLVVYDNTDNKHYGYNGTTWNAFY